MPTDRSYLVFPLYPLFLEYETMKKLNEYATRIVCKESDVNTDVLGDNIFLCVALRGAHARAILTREQALKLIDAINFALSANEIKP